MTSTFSPSLRLELMATGDQSGTWGDTTNTNLGTLLEQAITGVLSVAQGDVANLTLTTVNGGSDQARNAVVNITGALTAARNVVVQTANKAYFMKNSTTGGFAITAKTAAGTGVAIPPGTGRWVYADGTNVVDMYSGALTPSTDSGAALGLAATGWSALFINSTSAGTLTTITSTDAGATIGPAVELYRNSASPAASDLLGQLIFYGKDSAANKQEYASIQAVITDPTSTSEDSTLDFYVQTAGARVLGFSMGAGVFPFGVVRVQTFTSTGTYTPNANMVNCVITCVGSGGAGGGTTLTAARTGGGAGGGSGGYSVTYATAATIGASQTATVGNGGAASSGASGGDGADVSIGTLCIAKGGKGGTVQNASTGAAANGGAGGVAGTGDISIAGNAGNPGFFNTTTSDNATAANGAASFFGGAGAGAVSTGTQTTGGAGSSGGGGGGGANVSNNTDSIGGAGGKGMIVIVEFCKA